jgi:aryl-alcohol dehydrogenase-like predicted oxidoreductase
MLVEKRRLGSTDIDISVVGLGTVKFGRNQGVKYPAAFDLPSDEQCRQLLNLAKAIGINFLDTAPAYGSSETRLGQFLKGQRHDWVLATKVGEQFIEGQSQFDFSTPAIIQSIESSLRALQTDYLDMVLVHSNGDDVALIEAGVFEPLASLKEQGKIRAFGMSTKTIAGGKLAVDLSDVVMVSFNPTYTDERDVIVHAHEKQKGVLIKKALASGHLVETVSPIDALRLVLAEPGVTSAVVGTLNPQHLLENTCF